MLTYGYDNDSRISSMSYQLGTTSVGSLTYQYDAAGRRTQMGGSLAATGFPQAVSSAAYDVANELTGWNGTTISYDANGNILNDGVAAYTWNGRNQLISRGSTSFQYDSYGRRTLNAAGNNLLYEGLNAGQELSGSTPIANRILGGIDEFFNRADSTGAYSPITNALGSILGLTNSSGIITTQYGYDPFGSTTSSGGTSTNVSQYTGRENDGNGLYSYRARYYSPTFGRFVSEDPLGFGGGSFNNYAYANDSPVADVDPTGLSTTIIIVKDPVGPGDAGTHAGIYIDNNGDPLLYDPAGGYPTDRGCGSGDACSNSDNGTSLPDYINYQLSKGSSVDTYTFGTNAAEEATIANNIGNEGGGFPGGCTLAVCDVMHGVGPFKNMPSYFFPGNLGRDLAGRACVTKHYEPKSRNRSYPFISGPLIFPMFF